MATASQLGAGTIDCHKHKKYDGSGHQVNIYNFMYIFNLMFCLGLDIKKIKKNKKFYSKVHL